MQLASEQPKSLPILGLAVDILPDYTQWLAARIAQNAGLHVVTLNAEMTMQARENPELAQIIQEAGLVIPDGAGVVMHFRLRGRKIDRCPGIEMAEALLQASAQEPWSFSSMVVPRVSRNRQLKNGSSNNLRSIS